MSSLIEQAAQRLAQLRQAGVEVDSPLLPQEGAGGGSGVGASTEARDVPGGPAPARDVSRGAAPVPEVPPVGEEDAAAAAVRSRQVALDLDALAQANIIVPGGARSALADQYRTIKRPLIANATGKSAGALNHANLIMVTSALPGEGKTFTAINLAMSIATELDHTVMLVDADVARPSVLPQLGLPEGPGLLDLLDGSVTMPEVLLRTNVEKLTLLPSGTPHARATEMLASDAMRRLLDDMAQRYPDRIIIFDSPPLLLTTESPVLASQMGQIVVVVHAGKTVRSDVDRALASIENCPVRLMLLNQAREGRANRYGYGYGYGYGQDRGRADDRHAG